MSTPRPDTDEKPATCPTTGRPLYNGLPVPWVVEWTEEQRTAPMINGAVINGVRWLAYDHDNPFGFQAGAAAQRDEHGVLWYRTGPGQDTGTPKFAVLNAVRQRDCMIKRLCQVCGRPFGRKPVTFLLADDGAEESNDPEQSMLIYTPPTCLDCIPITMAVCPHQATKPRVVATVRDYAPASVLGDVYSNNGQLESPRQELGLDDPVLTRTVAKQLGVLIPVAKMKLKPIEKYLHPATDETTEPQPRTPTRAQLRNGITEVLTFLNTIVTQHHEDHALYEAKGLIKRTTTPNGSPGWHFHPRIPDEEQRAVLAAESVNCVYDIWKAAPVVYAAHPQMISEMARYQRSRIPSSMLERLRHQNPLIVFPEPIQVVEPEGYFAQLRAIFITGMTDGVLSSTHDPQRDGLCLSMITTADDSHGMLCMPVDTSGPYFDPAEAARRTAVQAARVHTDEPTNITRAKYSADLVEYNYQRSALGKASIAAQLLMYLFASNVDLKRAAPEHQPKIRRSHRRAPRAPQPVVHEYGWVRGPELFTERVRHERLYRNGTGLGGTKRPHPRAGYLGIRWTGPGRSIPDYREISPTYIHADRATEALPTVIDLT